jgi:hypothetical protein
MECQRNTLAHRRGSTRRLKGTRPRFEMSYRLGRTVVTHLAVNRTLTGDRPKGKTTGPT